MASGFGGGKFGSSLYRKKQREKLIFLFASGMALSIFLMLVVVFVSKSATASKSQTVPANVVAPISGTVTLFTSERSIPAGTKISTAALKQIFWPRDSMPAGAVTQASALDGRYAKVDIVAGEPIISEQLSDRLAKVDLLDVAPGMRAVSIEVDAKRGMDEWAVAGARVDVVITYTEGSELITKMAVENARILKAGNKPTGAASSGNAGRYQITAPDIITLEVTPQDALKLETASQMGKLSLHLRSQEDSRPSGIESFGSNQMAPKKESAPKPEIKAAPSCQRGRMKIEGKEYIVDCNGDLIPVK
jgi:pilus assembly protein CpaB